MFGSTRDPLVGGTVWQPAELLTAEGYADFASEFAGASFGGGLYRIHDDKSGPAALALIGEAFPEFASRACPFGYDWLGRQFAVDSGRVEEGQPLVLLVEPGTGEALEIPTSFAAFHDEEVVDYTDEALAREFFHAWAASHDEPVTVARDQCVGYKVPLFLGGAEDLDNLELSKVEVYWSICGQLRLGTMKLLPGAPISRIELS